MNKIKDRFLKGMDKSILKSKYCRNVKDELSNLGIELSNELRLSMEEIVVRFTKLNDMIYEAEMKALSENVFKSITNFSINSFSQYSISLFFIALSISLSPIVIISSLLAFVIL